uniref:Immunoglobulin V-set domain-containing protein n=1 Tax=Aotus nancymaae TaxID=37293 RepID=A0A2K5CQ32_AOTNA
QSEPSLSGSPGGMVTLTCGLSSGSVSISHYPSWYQQTPGQAPHLLICSPNTCHSGIPGHPSGSILGNKVDLHHGGSVDGDSDHYCVLHMGSSNSTVI